jgi:protein-S-isoprenylcysteine O-methyltransferase Ste14
MFNLPTSSDRSDGPIRAESLWRPARVPRTMSPGFADRGDGSMGLKALVGSGDRIALIVLPAFVVGLILSVAFPGLFAIDASMETLRLVSIVVLIPGVAIWAWSAVLILRHVPRGELITNGPYALVKHPLYTAVALLVLPWIGFLLGTWLGVVIGAVLYVAARFYAPEEEAALAKAFGARWEAYLGTVKLPWL